MQPSVTASEELAVNSVNFTMITKKVMLCCYACNLGGTTTDDLLSTEILYPNFLLEITLCSKKIHMTSFWSTILHFIYKIYIWFTTSYEFPWGIIAQGKQDFLGRADRYPNTYNNMYIFCYWQAGMWQSQSHSYESFTTLVKPSTNTFFLSASKVPFWSPSITTSMWTQKTIIAHSSSLFALKNQH